MNRRDEHELRWWREVFSQRFMPGQLPRVGEALGGHRFSIYIEDEGITWADRHEPWSCGRCGVDMGHDEECFGDNAGDGDARS